MFLDRYNIKTFSRVNFNPRSQNLESDLNLDGLGPNANNWAGL